MTLEVGSYEEAVAAHEWRVPERYNIAADVCDKHPRDKLGDDPRGLRGHGARGAAGASCRTWPNRSANVLRAHGVERGDRVAVLLPPTPETAAIFFGTWKRGAILLSMSVLYGDDGIRHRLERLRAEGPRHRRGQRARRVAAEQVLVLDDELLDRRADVRDGRHRGRRPGAALLHLRHHRARQGHRARPPLPARARGVRLLPRGAGRRALPRHGRVGVGGRASRRCSGRGGSAPCSSSTSARAASTRTSSSTSCRATGVTNVFTTPTAMRSMMSIADAGTRYPQKFRVVCSAGEPLNPEAIRWFREQYGLTVLDYYGLTESYPLVANYPFMEVREGSMGKPMPGWDVADPRRGRAAGAAGRARRDLPARAVEPALSARLLAQRGGVEGDVRRRVVPHQGRRRVDEDGYVWYEGRADDVIIAAGYRIGPFEVESACLEHAGGRARRRRSPRPTSGAATS